LPITCERDEAHRAAGCTQALCHLVAVQFGQADIKKHHVGFESCHGVERFLATVDRERLMSVEPQ